MGTKYTTLSASGYNSSPPSDDGSATESNRVYWSTIKTKLGDPVYNWISSIDSALVTYVNVGPTPKSSAYTTVAADHLTTIEVTGTTTITLGAVASMGAGYTVRILNNGSGTVTVDGSGAETINGVASFTLPANTSVLVQVDSTASNYYILSYGALSETVGTLGTVEASKVITVDSNKDTTGIRNLTGTGTATFAAFSGPLTGNVIGNLTGNVTGNCTGSSGSCTGQAATIASQGALATENQLSSGAQLTAATAGNYLDSVIYSFTATGAGYVGALAKAFEMIAPRSGTFRILIKPTARTGNANIKIYKNGAAVGTLRSNPTIGTWIAEDIGSITAGDLIQFYCQNGASSDSGTYSVAMASTNPLLAGALYTYY